MDNEGQRLRIAMLTANTLEDRKRSSWGGTVDRITQTLQKHCGDVQYVGTIHSRKKLLGKVINKATRLILKKNYLFNHTFSLARSYAKVANPRLASQPFDVIIAPSGGTEIAFLETDIPIVLIEDANFALLHNYYAGYSNLIQRSAYETNELEKLAIKKASLILHPSPWAAQSTIENYHADKQKVHAVPFGANFDTPPPIEVVQQKKRSDHCKLFFLAVDWVRKGGEIAFETLLKLEELGIKAELTICGCVPPAQFQHERMRVIPFLDKRIESQRREMEQLFATSDFLFVPTRSDCYGMVFCEASSYGLPTISTNTGGVSGAVTEGENGFLLPPEARGREYAELIARIYQDEARYAALVKSSRAAFDDRLNWDAWGITVTRLIHEMLERRTSYAATAISGRV
ncbi:glycosyltransferase [Ktedonosporobacter rubrisoli]|uniref:Glycosyltransferase n=1 Tax=Ktedonosporobacter rubrisoli TaxID=2509675 RepID=A0A4V0Z053_KTERU|nr:glycosyltransferase family 4 protein [Ktedonosporobacter rubrisoli]QBD82021.1 glycosyltransferase [Ktedonosporobacter rubrisoli]